MSFSLCYWILMLIWLVGGAVTAWPNLRASWPNLVLFLLLLVIGWQVFGAPLHS